MNPFGELDIHLKIPDLWQQDALHAIKAGEDVVVDAPTGAGKTYLVELIAESYRHGQIVLAVPTRALANDKLREFRAKGWRVGIVTGDVTVDPEAPVVVATLETQKPRFLKGQGPKLFVIDEYQMIGDAARGINYELCVALAPPETQLLLLSGSVSNPSDIVDWLSRLARRSQLIQVAKRPVPLEEIHLDALSFNPPRSVTGFWPRLLAKALLAELGPVLVFTPRRKEAESMARQFAAALPLENTLALSPAQKRLAGGVLEKLLSKRIAFHHSGLSYQQRAGLVEPLAKAGQLRIVVSTTGLAAGVNFSMRSVLITESQYTMGAQQQLIRSDELLQMFGRAGRRGFDTVGYALVAPDRPRLREGKAQPVRRPKLLDWPSLIGLLDAAVERREKPYFKSVQQACTRLFSRDEQVLGFEHSIENTNTNCRLLVDAERARFAQANSEEFLNSRGTWEVRREKVAKPLGEVFRRRKGELIPLLQDYESLKALGEGKTVRLEAAEPSRLGKSRLIGFVDKKRKDIVQLSGWLLSLFRASDPEFKRKVAISELPSLDWRSLRATGVLLETRVQGHRVFGVFDLAECIQEVDVDVFEIPLFEPKTRRAYPHECQSCSQLPVCSEVLSPRRTPAWSWRCLGLIEPDGRPTRRGRIFSFFQGGEGLAIAAALEDASYAVDAIAHDIANLRAGYRFDAFSQYSHRLARSCRNAYQDWTYDGYLQHGLPPHYGDGAAEVIAEWSQSAGKGKRMLGEELRFGDVQRARQEWLSLLRHIAAAPDMEFDRWRELQACSKEILRVDEQSLLVDDLPPLEPSQTSRIEHKLRFPRRW